MKPFYQDQLANVRPRAVSKRQPVGVYSLALALVITIGLLLYGQAYAGSVARNNIRSIGSSHWDIKWQSLIIQRAVLSQSDLLPFYGSSMLYCCDVNFRGPDFFGSEPTGFNLVAIGIPGLEAPLYFQALAALGSDLRGKKIVVIHSTELIFTPNGLENAYYDGLFSPEIAEAFVFDSPVSLGVKREGAKRMLSYPETLRNQPILRLAVRALASNDSFGGPAFSAIYPAGRVQSWVDQLKDAYNTVQFFRTHQRLQPRQTGQRTVDWQNVVQRATVETDQVETSNPFAFGATYMNVEGNSDSYRHAFRQYCAGQNNRNGNLISIWQDWRDRVATSSGWTDLNLEFAILNELQAEPLVVTTPIAGVFYDFTGTSIPARQLYYNKFVQIADRYHVPALTFAEFDEQRGFNPDPSGHFGRRGWAFFNRAVDRYFHGFGIDAIQSELTKLNQEVPPSPLPEPSTFAGCH